MSSNLKTGNLSALIAEAEKIRDEAKATFGQLSPAQLNWKRSPEEWSIGQCFDHLILTNRPYFPVIEKIAAGQQQTKLWERVPLLPGLFGKLVLGAVSPLERSKRERDFSLRRATLTVKSSAASQSIRTS